MNKIYKYLVPFFIAAVMPLSSWAETIQGGSPAIQGGSSSSVTAATLESIGSLEFYIDATERTSYSGAGDSWLESRGYAVSDFHLGVDATTDGTEPTFLDEAADPDAAFLFDGADLVRMKANTAFVKRIHKTDETSLGATFSLSFYWPTNPKSGTITLFGTADAFTDHGFQFVYNNTGSAWTLNQAGNAGSYSATALASGVAPERGTFNLVTFSIQKTSGTAGTWRFKLNDNTVLTGSLTAFNATTTDPADSFQLSGVGTTDEFPSEMKTKGLAAYSKSLTEAEENTAQSTLETTYANTFPTSTEDVRHLMWNSPNNLLAVNTDSIDVATENWFTNNTGFMTIRFKTPGTFTNHDYLTIANDGTTSNTVGMRIDSTGKLFGYVRGSGADKHVASNNDTQIADTVNSAAITWASGTATIVSGGLKKTVSYSGNPTGLDILNFAANAANAGARNLTIYDAYWGNSSKTLAELQQYLFHPNDILAAGGGQSLLGGLFDSQDSGAETGKQNFRTAIHSGLVDGETVVFANGSTGGSAAAKTTDPSTFWWDVEGGVEGQMLTNFKLDMASSGLIPNVLIWSQGESDSLKIPSLTTKAQYKSALLSIFTDIRSTYGAMPVIIQGIGRHLGLGDTGGVLAVRDVQLDLASEYDWIHYGPDSYDVSLFDNVHLSDAGYATMGTRLGNKVLDVFGYTVASADGPTVASASRSTTAVTVELTHDSGTDFTPTTAIEGFRFFHSDDEDERDQTEISITGAVRTDADTITLTLASEPTKNYETLWYIYDSESSLTVANTVVDNASLPTPLKAARIEFPPFTPLALLPEMYVDSVGASNFVLNGVDISQWTDLSGNGNHLLQATSSAQPFYNTVTDEVEFDGVLNRMATAAFSSPLSQPNTVFAVYNFVDTASEHTVYDGIVSGSRHLLQTNPSSLQMFGGTANDTLAGADTSDHIIASVYNGASSQGYIDGGTDLVTTDIGSHTLTGLTVGSLYQNSQRGKFNARSFIVYDRALTTAEINRVGNYLADRFGITWTDI